jgi:ATP-dependent Clp protease ATP-binding subunit ClpC
VIEPQHILLGVLDAAEGIGAKVLAMLGGSAGAVREAVAATLPRGQSATTGHPRFSEAGKAVLGETLDATLDLGHNYVGTEHILLGVLRVENAGNVALADMGITLDGAKQAVSAALMGYQHRGRRG